jgi:3-deoxy-manno-octulosonate cytidylyltransferase (CMP-KDO synthetase)
MIAHVYDRARQAHGVDAVIVATDDPRIAEAVRAFGGTVQMTSPLHRTGTDRIAEVAGRLDCAVVVNVQGDEPLIVPGMIEEVVRPLLDDDTLPMATLRRTITDPADYTSPHVVKVTVNAMNDALYFSRAPIPATPAGWPAGAMPACDAHVGLYAYRRDFLLTLAALPQTPLERIESLEQLRALEHGYRIRAVPTRHASVGVDTPEDLERARRQLALAGPS